MSFAPCATNWLSRSYLFDTCTVIFLKATFYPAGRDLDVAKFLSIKIFGLGSHARDGQDLLVFLDTLLEFAEEYSQTCEWC